MLFFSIVNRYVVRDGDSMAQRFWGVYQSILNKSTFSMPLDELTDLQDHIRNELLQKFRYYGSPDLQADVHLLEDLSHECYAEIAESIGNFNPEFNTFKNWIDGLILNRVRSYFRLKKNRSLEILKTAKVNDDGELEEPELWGQYFSAHETVLRKERLKYYRKAMAVLLKKFPKYHQVIYLRCFKSYSSYDAAEVMGCTVEEIYRWLNRAILKLEILIEEIETSTKSM
jgi:RNA polymerase sigma factor (sigma-70 family)